jgi:hypothetical protein
VVLLVEGERFPAHQGVLAARSEYLSVLFLSGLQGGSSEGGVQEIEQVSAGALRVVMRHLYTAELPESGEGGAGAGGGRGEGSSDGGGKSKGDGEQAKRRQVLEREVLMAADLFSLEPLLQHCMEAFSRGLQVNTVMDELVWAHSDGPAEARKVITEYFVRNIRRIRVRPVYNFLPVFSDICFFVPCPTNS